MKKVVTRTCIGCNEKRDKKELLRIVKNKENEISIDKTGKKEGRGAYICKNKECLEKAIKNRKLEKSFKMKISEEVYENLRDMMINGGDAIE